MKRNLLKRLIVIVVSILISFYSLELEAQSIHIVPNPDTGQVNGFLKYKDNLYIIYKHPSGITQLAMYNGDSITLIPNPDVPNPQFQTGIASTGMAVLNNKIYFEYINSSNVRGLAQYDGSSITLLKTYPSGVQLINFSTSFVYNSKYYCQYYTLSGNSHWAQFDGTNFTLLPDPDEGGEFETWYNSEDSVALSRFVYNNKLYFFYKTVNRKAKLLQFDGTSFSFIPNPDEGVGAEGFGLGATSYNNKLYFPYTNIKNRRQLAQFDGTSVTLVPNSDTISGGFTKPVVYNNNLYTIYLNDSGNVFVKDTSFYYMNDSGIVKKSGVFQLAKFDGSSITLIPKPDVSYFDFPYNKDYTGYGHSGKIVEYNNKLFTQYFRTASLGQFENMAKTDADSSTLIPNMPGGYYYIPVDTFHNNLIFLYVPHLQSNGYYSWGLGEYDGTNLTLIPNPDTGYGLNTAWLATRIIFNDTLFFIYDNSAGKQQLAYLAENRTLPINLLNFIGQLQINDAFLQWQTATEQNSNHFTIQRSKDGTNFTDIGTVKASGSSTAVRSYNYTDPAVIKLGAPKLFYRLQEVDNDGKKQLSNIVSINITGINNVIIMYPNPAKNSIYFDVAQQLSQNAQVILYDINGRKAAQQKPQSNNLHQQLNVNNQPSGNYTVEVIDNGKTIFTGKVIILR